MSHEIRRVLRAFATRPWFIDARSAQQIVAILEYRSEHGPRAQPYREEPAKEPTVEERKGKIAVLNLMGAIVPRSSMVDDLSGPTVASLEMFQAAFDKVAKDDDVVAIVINVDSPGGSVDLVPETAAKIRAARREGRPIIAIANTLAASAAYWIASAADELVVTPSGEVGSIGVYMLHQDISDMLEAEGVRMTFIKEGPRKTEGNPFEPLDAPARNALQATARHYYDLFVKDVAKARNVSEDVVRADPEETDKHFGGGRVYPSSIAVKLGMADRVDTLEGVLQRLQASASQRRRRRADLQRRRLALA